MNSFCRVRDPTRPKILNPYPEVFPEKLESFFYDDNQRVIVTNEYGNVMCKCSTWLFEQCWLRGYFVD